MTEAGAHSEDGSCLCRKCKSRQYSAAYRARQGDKLRERKREQYLARRDEIKDQRRRAYDPKAQRSRKLQHQFKMTLEDYDQMLASQGGVCAMCGTNNPGSGLKNFSIDHNRFCCPGDKSCGECVRGLLCSVCNTRVGVYEIHRESIESYLSR